MESPLKCKYCGGSMQALHQPTEREYTNFACTVRRCGAHFYRSVWYSPKEWDNYVNDV